MATALKSCCACGKEFLVKYRFQIDQGDGAPAYYCSQECRKQVAGELGDEVCSVCGARFEPKYAYQKGRDGTQAVSFCSMSCRNAAVQDVRRRSSDGIGAMRIAVLNQKGGTGKTTTAVSLAAGLAQDGQRVLLIDVDSQGHVGVSLLGEKKHKTLYHLLVEDNALSDCVVEARPNLDLLTGNETLAAAEIYLARLNEGRESVLRRTLGSASQREPYDFVLLDCGPSLSLLNMNALTYADYLLIPVSCDYLSLVGVKQVLKTLKSVNRELMHPISILGILPTFYDMRNNISDEAVKTLRGYFHDKVLAPIRVNTRLKEAPRHGRSIFEYAPESRGASDYRKLVRWVLKAGAKRVE